MKTYDHIRSIRFHFVDSISSWKLIDRLMGFTACQPMWSLYAKNSYMIQIIKLRHVKRLI